MWDRESKDCSVVGEDLTLNGNLSSKSNLMIEGYIEGNVSCASLFVCRTGKVVGEVQCENALIEGTVNGVVTSIRVELRDGCVLEGDIASETLEIDHGATFSGSSRPLKPATRAQINEAAE